MNLKLLALFIGLVIISARCKKDSNSPDEINITGNWKQKKVLMEHNGTSLTFDETNTSCLVNSNLTISKDGNYTITYTGVSACVANVNTSLAITFGEPGKVITGTWAQLGQNFTMTANGISAGGKITGSGSNEQLTISSYSPDLQVTTTNTYSR